MPNRNIAPPIKDAIEFQVKLAPCTCAKLNNGVPLYYINDGAEEVAQIDFVFYAGNSFETKEGIAATTNYLLKNGTNAKTAFEISEFFEYYGAFVNRSCYNETATITLHCLSKYVKELLPVIREMITESIFPEEEIEIFKQNSIQRLSVNLLKCDFVANRLIDTYLYGAHHPYGKVTTEQGIQAITRENLQEFFKEYYINAHCQIFAAGKLPTNFEKIIDDNFGDLSIYEKKEIKFHERESAQEKKYRIQNDDNGVQGAIRIARAFPNRLHPDYHSVKVLNALFGGYFGSRLMANIREEKGYTYGISSYLQSHLQSTAWMVSTEAGKDVCEQTIHEVYEEMKLLRENLIDEEELLLVKNYLMGINLGYLDGPFNVIAQWKNLILHGLDENYFNQSINTTKNVTSKELQLMAQKYLVPEDFYELVVI